MPKEQSFHLENLNSVTMRKYYMCLRASMVGLFFSVLCLVLFLVFPILGTNISGILVPMLFLMICFFCLLASVFLLVLGQKSHKNFMLLVMLAVLLPPLGTVFSFLRIRYLFNKTEKRE